MSTELAELVAETKRTNDLLEKFLGTVEPKTPTISKLWLTTDEAKTYIGKAHRNPRSFYRWCKENNVKARRPGAYHKDDLDRGIAMEQRRSARKH